MHNTPFVFYLTKILTRTLPVIIFPTDIFLTLNTMTTQIQLIPKLYNRTNVLNQLLHKLKLL